MNSNTINLVNLVIGVISLFVVVMAFLNSMFSSKPDITVSASVEDGNLFSLTNIGGNLINCYIEIFWKQNGELQKRKINNFLYDWEDRIRTHPHKCSVLKKGNTRKALNVPLYSDDGEIHVLITGEWNFGFLSRLFRLRNFSFKKEFIVKNDIK